MSVKLRFSSTPDGGLLQRSRSFTGFGSLSGTRSPSARNSLRAKAMAGGKSPRMHLSPRRGSGLTWSLQPDQVDQVFQALRRGLREHLEGHQAEMDFLSSQQRESKRNSRLAFLYDLEKEIRALERFIRRLEFQISKVEELYESYCIQRRLSQGAVNMKRAFSLSPSSRASRESLLELNRNHRHSLQDMSTMEEELEVLLGELHIKMKGLIGFARLCPGDQYEVVVRLGRQRWRIRGRIESDDSQSWDQEDMVFLPHIHHNFEIKVTEAKGLGWLLVGAVTCASADFFAVKPRLMLVDVTELGTIKLQLEVSWSPLDSVPQPRPLSVSSRKSSVYSWTAPNTPSFSEKYFMSMVRQLQDEDGSLPSLLSPGRRARGGVSLLSYLSHPSHGSAGPQSLRPASLQGAHGDPSSPSPGASQTQLSLGGQEQWGAVFDSPSSSEDSGTLERCSTPDLLRKSPGGGAEPEAGRLEAGRAEAGRAEAGRAEQNSSGSGLSPVSPSDHPPVASPSSSPSSTAAPSAGRRSEPGRARGRAGGGAGGGALALRLGALMAEVEKGLRDQDCWDRRLRALDHQILHLGTILKNDLSLMRSRVEEEEVEESLEVEQVLESFDFLSQDFPVDEDASRSGSWTLQDSGIGSVRRSGPRNPGRTPSQDPLPFAPLTSGNWSLDQALETHLDLCCILLQTLRTSTFEASRTKLLDEVSLQADVLDRVSALLLEDSRGVSAGDVLRSAQTGRDLLLFWDECGGGGGGVRGGGGGSGASPFCCSADTFCRTLKRRYTHRVKARQPGQADKVFSQLLQQVQAPCRVVPAPRPVCSPDRVSVFQLWVYLRRWSVQELGQHIQRLSREEYILSALRGPKRRRALSKLRGRSLAELLPLGSTLQTLAGLLTDSNLNVCRAAAGCLRRAAGCKALRSQALVFYTEGLRSSDVLVQQGSCLALKCLKAVESVDHIADLWREEGVPGLPEDGPAVQRLGGGGLPEPGDPDHHPVDPLLEAYQNQNQETQITIL
ncbi:RIPOR family member 3-like isoform X3 [Salarias fasciatus]|uniref:RIPOR family member 3-like isoform X3 n=1 Tax=Salarias fasciatus TaxID=181472 RepID=UPI001176DEB8|nr:RIPOR family member 3-like isoform X3 [Salarias fasciatus]